MIGRLTVATGAALCLLLSSPALGQSPDAPQAAPAAELEARLATLQAEVDALRAALEEVKSTKAAATPSWKGAPQFEDAKAGWSFKPRGRLMYDVGYVDGPDGYGNPGLGFSNELRRGRLGVEGSMPGGFGYRFEMDFADGAEVVDAYLDYRTGKWTFTVGQHNNFQSLDELTSSLHSSFIERAAFTDAFGFERRVGASAQYADGAFLAQAGLFSDNIADLNDVGDDNNSFSLDGRLVYAPKVGKTQLHFGASAHHRDINDAATSVRYRQRPAVHTTDVRFIDTGSIGDARTETGFGLEAAGIFGPLHLAGEAFWQSVGRASGEDPSFFGAYLEGGYFLTGESRGYRAGRFDRVKVKRPFADGGWGALGVNVRWDHLDLEDGPFRGGVQNAFQASLNWKPTDYVLFGVNAGLLLYEDAAIAAAGDRDYSARMAGVRAQVDF